MATAKGPKNVNISLQFEAPQKRMYFNSYVVDAKSFKTHFLFKFALVEANDVADEFAFVMYKKDFLKNKESFLRFASTNAAEDTEKMPSFGYFRKQVAPDVVDIISVSRHGEIGEIALHCFSWKGVLELGRSVEADTSKAPTIFCALLRSDFGTVKSWIEDCFA